MRTSLLTVLCLLACPFASAQEAPTPADEAVVDTIPVEAATAAESTEPAPAALPDTLAEIIVTAQKTEQSLHDIPLSITAIGGDFIKDIGAADLTDVAVYVPNVRVDTDDAGSPQVFIRGFGTNTFNPSFESSVGFVQDEIFFGRGAYFTEALFDIERVEVLRGPQGTLFGKNTIAGLFNVVSRGPMEDFSGDVRISGGEHGERRLEGGVGGMLTDNFGARLAVLDQADDGELYNQFLDRSEDRTRQNAQRLKLRYLPIDDIDMELTAVRSETSLAFWPQQLFLLDAGTRSYLQSFDPAIEDDPDDFTTSFDAPGYIDKGSKTVSLKTDWTIGELGGIDDLHGVLVVGGSRLHIDQLNDLDVSPADLLRLDNFEDYDQQTAELRFTGSADSLFGLGQNLEFVAGAYYFASDYELLARVRAGGDIGSFLLTDDFAQLATGDNTVSFSQALSSPGIPVLGQFFQALGFPGIPLLGQLTAPIIGEDFYQFDYRQKVSATALFAQVTWHLSERWAITPGLRINREEKKVRTAGTSQCPLQVLSACVTGLVLEANNYEERGLKREETDLSPKVAVQYIWNDDLNFFSSYTRGFKSGGYNSLSFTGEDLEFKPEKAATAELGFKGRFLERRLNFNTTLYQTQFDNLQVLAFNGTFFDVGNAASAKSKGLEADFQWLTPFRPLTISGSFGLLDARYDSYPAAPAPISQGQGQLQDLSGKRIAFAPKQTATLTPTLTIPFSSLAVRTSVDVIYQGDQFTDTDLDPNTYVDGYFQYAARISLGNISETWSLTVGGSNLNDKRVQNQVIDALLFPGTFYAQQAAGRQLFAALSINW